MLLRSSSFGDGQRIPTRHTCDGEDKSPPLEWNDVPKGTRSFVVLCDDPDAPRGTWHHWAAFDIPAERTRLAEGIRPSQTGMKQGINDFGQSGYRGPCPPRHHGPHRYRFRILALSVAHLAVSNSPSFSDVESAAGKYLIEEAGLIGVYERS
jgi:Raf kinase inhibitor-like YbhB/YbcL family protein